MYKSSLLNKVMELSNKELKNIIHMDLHRLSQIDTKIIAYDIQGNCFKSVILTSLLTKEVIYDAFEEIYEENSMLDMIEIGKNELKKPFRHFLEVNLDSEDLATVPVPKKVTDKVFEALQKQIEPKKILQGDFEINDFKDLGLRFVKSVKIDEIVMVIFYDHKSTAIQQIFYLADINEIPLEQLREFKKDLKDLYITEL